MAEGKYQLIYSHLARVDLEKIVSYYYDKNRSTAKKYYQEILERTKKLQDFPELGRIVEETEDLFYDKYRQLMYEHYRIIYKIYRDKIVILRILDSRMSIDFNLI